MTEAEGSAKKLVSCLMFCASILNPRLPAASLSPILCGVEEWPDLLPERPAATQGVSIPIGCDPAGRIGCPLYIMA